MTPSSFSAKQYKRISTQSGVIPVARPVRIPKDVSTSRRRRVSRVQAPSQTVRTSLKVLWIMPEQSKSKSETQTHSFFPYPTSAHSTHFAGLLALVFEHISLDDKGNWTCEMDSAAKPREAKKSFELLVNRKSTWWKCRSHNSINLVYRALNAMD